MNCAPGEGQTGQHQPPHRGHPRPLRDVPGAAGPGRGLQHRGRQRVAGAPLRGQGRLPGRGQLPRPERLQHQARVLRAQDTAMVGLSAVAGNKIIFLAKVSFTIF